MQKACLRGVRDNRLGQAPHTGPSAPAAKQSLPQAALAYTQFLATCVCAFDGLAAPLCPQRRFDGAAVTRLP